MAHFGIDDLPVKPHELEFLAGDELVTIVPNFSLDSLNRESQLHGIRGLYGPFTPGFPVDVPLWLALTLHKKKKCRILAPEWMSLPSLTNAIDAEKGDPNVFQPLPTYYIETGHMLLMHAKDTFSEDHYQIRDAFESLRNTRWGKIKEGLQVLQEAVTVRMNNLAAGECALIRLTLVGALDTFQALKNAQQQQQTQGFTPTPM